MHIIIEVLTQKSQSIIASIPLIPSYQPTQKNDTISFNDLFSPDFPIVALN
jgi:FMN-dependent NADH-azoreductase